MPSQAVLNLRRFVLNLRAALLIVVWCLTAAASVQAQTPAATPFPDATPDATREERQLNEARRQNEEAQAEYYRTQTKKLNEPAPTKSFWRTLSDNAAILGALTAALVALFTLIVNQRTALRARKDTEFYEALKRFGDHKSATVRASAAGMLARISDTSFVIYPRRRPNQRWRDLQKNWWQKPWEWIKKRTVFFPYFDTTLDQLVTGLSIEEHAVVVAAITDALARLIPRNRDRAAAQLYIANRRLQIQLVEQLAWVVALFADHDKWKESSQVWRLACSYTGYSREALEDLPDIHEAEFNVARQEASLKVKTTKQELRSEIEDRVRISLKAIGSRLRQNVALIVQPFEKRTSDSKLDLSGAFLANARFPDDSNLRSVNLRKAILFQASLESARLQGADLRASRLEGADLEGAELEDTRMVHARIDQKTSLYGSNWWKADFTLFTLTSQTGETQLVLADHDIFDDIIQLMGVPSSKDLAEAHPSVRLHMSEGPMEKVEQSREVNGEKTASSGP